MVDTQYQQSIGTSIKDKKQSYTQIRSLIYSKSVKIFHKLHEYDKVDICILESTAKEYIQAAEAYLTVLENKYYNELMKEILNYHEIISIFSLSQIIYFSADTSNLIKQLADWCVMRYYAPLHMPSLKIMNIIYSPCPLQHPDFWPSVFELLLVGRFQTLSDLLTSAIKSQSQSNKGIMIVIEQLSVIINQGYDHLSLGEISQMKFKVSTMVAHDPETNYHISKVNIALSILGGDTKYIIEYSQDKIQAFIMTLYYQYSEPKDIHTSATTFFSAYKTSSETGEILVYSSLLQNDIFKAFEYCAQYDWWLLSHLVDLFECKQALDRPITYERNGQRISAKCSDYFITFYASSIVKQYNLLDVAYAYWITCGEMGKQMLDEYLENSDLNKDDALEELVPLSIEYSSEEHQPNMYSHQSLICFQTGNYSKALRYHILDQKYKTMDHVFEDAIKYYVITGRLIDIPLSHTKTQDGVYHDIYQHMIIMEHAATDHNMLEVISIFMELILSDNTPGWVLPILFCFGIERIPGKDSKGKYREGHVLKDMDSILGLAYLDLLQLNKIKKKLQTSQKYFIPKQFKWYYYYSNRESDIPHSIDKAEKTIDDEQSLEFCMSTFFDLASILLGRAINKHISH